MRDHPQQRSRVAAPYPPHHHSPLPKCSPTTALCATIAFSLISAAAVLLSPSLASRLTSAPPPLHALASLPGRRLAESVWAGAGSSGSSDNGDSEPGEADRRAGRVALHAITLAFNLTEEHATVSHNCALLAGTRHTYEIHTDDLSQPYCRLCRCVRYAPTHCKCFHPEQRDCPLCEKLAFVTRMIRAHREFVFLDGDVALLRRDYLDLLSARTHDFDFLAMYDDWGGPCNARYTTSVNSGLMFVRRVLAPAAYDELRDIMVRRRTNDDQGVISHFIRKHYERWDTLGLRWHCRSIWKPAKNIPPTDCYAAHMRGPRFQEFLRSINYTLLDSAKVLAARR